MAGESRTHMNTLVLSASNSVLAIANFPSTKCITAAVIWPIFTLLLILSWILSTVFLIASLAGADFCYGTSFFFF